MTEQGGAARAVLRVVTEHDTASPAAELTAREAAALAGFEKTIAAGVVSFVRVGLALAAIREQQLYRATHATFEEYAQQRWGLARAHAYRQIQAAQIAQVVSPVGDILPVESVLRELGPLRQDPDELVKAWKTACKRYGSRPTAKQVRRVVRDIAPGSSRRRDDGESQLRTLTATANASLGTLRALDVAGLRALDPTGRLELVRLLRRFAAEVLRVIKELEHNA